MAPNIPAAGPDKSMVTGFCAAVEYFTTPPLDCMIRNGVSLDWDAILSAAC